MGRSPCCEKAHTTKGAWSKEEDDQLIAHIRAHREGCWRSLPKAAGLLRCGKSCRLRWINYLRPDLKRGNITEDDEEFIIDLHSLLGNNILFSQTVHSSSSSSLPGSALKPLMVFSSSSSLSSSAPVYSVLKLYIVDG